MADPRANRLVTLFDVIQRIDPKEEHHARIEIQKMFDGRTDLSKTEIEILYDRLSECGYLRKKPYVEGGPSKLKYRPID